MCQNLRGATPTRTRNTPANRSVMLANADGAAKSGARSTPTTGARVGSATAIVSSLITGRWVRCPPVNGE